MTAAPARPRRSPTQRRGDEAEDLAMRHLERAGLRLLARNDASPLGEIDLVMIDGAEWVFVEVRRRAGAAFGGAAASVTPAKQRRIRLQAQHLLKRRFGDRPWPACRFDVCAIDDGRIDWLRDAFS
ncbi:MAG: YraN family protein [Burkholderiaceae bacterium]|nr:YraN family protein [Burkholderiaceae bacterium]MEB2320414.1 YraN family protein [Pseudomonadota bacterium]